jgi:uncharacterized RDD family membrane protein YckC
MKKYILIYSILMLTVGSIYPIFDVLGYVIGPDERDQLIGIETRDMIFGITAYFPNLPNYRSLIFPNVLGVNGYHYSSDGKFISNISDITIVALPYFVTWLVLLVGVVNFKKSNSGNLLSAILMISFLHFILGSIYNITTIFVNINEILYNFYGDKKIPIWKTILSVLVAIGYGFFLYRIIHFLNKNKQMKIDNSFYQETSTQRRILGRLIDVILILLFAFSTTLYLQVIFKLYFPESSFGYPYNYTSFGVWFNPKGFVIFNSFASFFYYLILESFFSLTPGKILMGSKVFNREEESPSFLAILGRTFCRFIPLEGIFFVFGYKLHDSISGTYVYDVEDV